MNLTKARNSIPIPADTLPTSNLARGVAVIEAQLATLSGSPGVYRMQDAKGDALYVGKARNLKKRVVAYTKPVRLPVRLQRMIALTASMEIITTHTEAEALLLEANLIKKLKPRYNVLLRDDKSFPYILITEGHDYARVVKHRGARGKPGRYFCICRSCQSHDYYLATSVFAPQLFRPYFCGSYPALFAVSNKKVRRSVCWEGP